MKNYGLCLMTAIVLMFGLTGCKAPLNKYQGVFDRYYATTLKMSTSGDVLGVIKSSQAEYLTQSESVVACWGIEGDKGRTHWFNMVAFDEEQMTAVRKYGFILEETREGWNRTPTPALRYDTEMVISREVLDKAYAGGNDKMIALLTESFKLFKKDAAELSFDSDVLRNSTMMVNQAMNTLLNRLSQSPAYAVRLTEPGGLKFDHPTLGESYIRMLLEDDILKVKIKAGQGWFEDGKTPFENQPDVQQM